MIYPDPSQFQQPGTPSYPQGGATYLPGIPGTQEVAGGPMGSIQDEVAGVLNGNGNGNRIFIPMQDQVGQPIVQVPTFRTALSDLLSLFRR
jgi:hypothetical protein